MDTGMCQLPHNLNMKRKLRTWLCIRRVNLPMANQDSASVNICKCLL
ncbi:hypothetical protein MTR67_049550 [Solanum verrucosum]|uniref:Uncharacterized protein n=1 Tax=Solanum verrucosum TaxID=315347 RepID=A0AAF1A0P0_SOLVR|nr:hypothetical protein MTR67_049550 [Solanum verrucosum]